MLTNLLIYVILCIIFQAVKEAIASGVDGYDADVKKSVRKAAHGLRLTREVAMSIAGKAVSIHFKRYELVVYRLSFESKFNMLFCSNHCYEGPKDFHQLHKTSTGCW
jgi:hypothetical protein